MTNRLAGATSPYLLQHADNPVDWWPWGDDAFAEARRRDVPVFLSVGYSACHWCHVMAHESFEDPEIAGLLGEHAVSVKVDREERPDVDAVYMAATQAMTGQGGWPMSCFLTPDGRPFFCGTYFPPTPRHGIPAFRQVVLAVAQAWRERRGDLERAADEVSGALAAQTAGDLPPGTPTAQLLDQAAATLAGEYDAARGGFGSAPKFPPAMVCEFLLSHESRTGDARSLEMVERTCERMARGGLYDQLAGGFARYSTDASWVVPHFEKMLYDNALLLRLYARLWRRTGSPLAERVTRQTAHFLLTELRTPQGAFAAALDADSEGEEGRFYVWTPDEVGPVAARLFGVTAAGTFEHGRSVLQLLEDPDDPDLLARERDRLAVLRARRVRPHRDDKVVAAWNGLAIGALAEAGTLLDEPAWVAAAADAADLVTGLHRVDGRLRRTSRDGRVGTSAAVLDDHAALAAGLLELAAATGDPDRLATAGDLLEDVLTRFADGRGGFYDTADDAEALVTRPVELTDNATPSGTSAAAGALLGYAALTGSARHREAAEAALARVGGLLPRFARFAGWAAAVGEALLAGPAEVAVVGPAGPDRDALARAARAAGSPGAVVAVGDPDVAPWAPLLADRPLVAGRSAAYVCRHFVCGRPESDPDGVRRALSRS